jgi:hypothetical protein
MGTEIKGTYDLTEQARAEIGYAYTRPLSVDAATIALVQLTTTDGERWLTYAPHQLKANLDLRFLDGALGVTGNAQAYSPARRTDTKTPLNAVYTRPRVVLNAAVRYAFLPSWTAKVSIQNLLGNTVPPRSPTMAVNPSWGNLGVDARMFFVDLTYHPG